MITIEYLNACDEQAFSGSLSGVYEHSPWIAQGAVAQRPFKNLNELKQKLLAVVVQADVEQQLGLIRAHPELAGKAASDGHLTDESKQEQEAAGLNRCLPQEALGLQQLNAEYQRKFGFPFVLAVKGPDGKGLTPNEITRAVARRLKNGHTDEIAESLRQIHRIAELRLNALFGHVPSLGESVMAWAQVLAGWSDEEGALTCAYLTPAHQKTAAQLAQWMQEAGMSTEIDALGNVLGRLASDRPDAKTLLTGSHYDTVRNGGKYDGREGILLPIAVVKHLHERGEKLPFHLEVIAFAEEEGVRYMSTFLGSSAITGQFDMALLDKQDADGITMRQAMLDAGHDPNDIQKIARVPETLLGFVEIHIEQGPILLAHNLPVGIVTSIAGSCRYAIELRGVASHAGTTPMHLRKDAAAAAAEIVLLVERRCGQAPSLVGTVGLLQVIKGSVNVVPGACTLSLDIRAGDDAVRDAAVMDVLDGMAAICKRRGIEASVQRILSTPAVQCAPSLTQQLAASTARIGLAPFHLSSGAGHDAMAMAAITEVAMLFTRCGNGGISHNPLEIISSDDAEVTAQIFLDFLRHFGLEPGRRQNG